AFRRDLQNSGDPLIARSKAVIAALRRPPPTVKSTTVLAIKPRWPFPRGDRDFHKIALRTPSCPHLSCVRSAARQALRPQHRLPFQLVRPTERGKFPKDHCQNH